MSTKKLCTVTVLHRYDRAKNSNVKVYKITVNTRQNSYFDLTIDDDLTFSSIDEATTFILNLLSVNNLRTDFSYIFNGIMYDILWVNLNDLKISKYIYRKEV